MNLVVLSGGLDSTCALALTILGGGETMAITFDYGQRHYVELEAARAVADFFDIEHRIVSLEDLMPRGGSALTSNVPVPEGHYAEESMAATVVPGRNLLFAAAAVAQATAGDSVVFGVHAGDHPIYPDCRPDFWIPLARAVRDAYAVSIETPFIGLTKAELLGVGMGAGAPVQRTWSCYRGEGRHCGRCGTCVERAEAFHLAGVDDPTIYEDPVFWQKATAGR